MPSTVPLIRLPELTYPTNALINFEPINAMLTDRRRMEEFNARQQLDVSRFQQQQTQDAARLGLDRDRLGIDRDRLGLERQRTESEIAIANRPQLIQGAPGTQIGEVVRDPSGTTVRPLMSVPARPRELSPSDLRGLRDEGSQLGSLNRLSAQFNDQFTMPGWGAMVNAGDARNWVGRHMSNSSGNAQAAAQWWQDYQRSLELVQRHALFGAALTPGEQASWRAAAVTPNMTPDAIRTNLGRQQALLQSGMTNYARSLVAQGFDPAVISEAYGVPPQSMGLPTARPVRTVPVGAPGGPPAAAPGAGPPQPQTQQPPAPDAQRGHDGNWYRPDPANPGRFLRYVP